MIAVRSAKTAAARSRKDAGVSGAKVNSAIGPVFPLEPAETGCRGLIPMPVREISRSDHRTGIGACPADGPQAAARPETDFRHAGLASPGSYRMNAAFTRLERGWNDMN